MHNLKISIGIFLALAASRFIPHPPNFTSLLALSFYIPVLFGIRFLPILVVSFILTDFIIGMHNVTLFTWGSIILIGLASKFFINTLSTRIFGSLLGACLFFIVTNFGVWSLGAYGYSLNSLMLCYTLALPFFAYTFISTFIFSGVIEGLYKFNFFKLKANK
jgi:hypothetical protein